MEDTLCNPSQYIGCRWRVQTRREGTVEGILKDYFPGNDSFTFDKAERVESADDEECEYIGVLGLFRHEILYASVVDCDEDIRRKYVQIQKATINKALDVQDLRICKKDLLSDCADDESSIESYTESDDEIISLCDVNEDDFNVDFDLQTNNWKAPFSEQLEFIDSATCDDTICSILVDISKMKMIGVAALGENISRFGYIDCMLVSTDNGNYVFCEDTWILKLKDVLQSTNTVKIIHGSGLLADTLLRKYKIRVQNVCDTQILDFFIRKKEKSKKKKLQQPMLSNYRRCLRDYLGIVVPSVYTKRNFTQLKATHPSDAFDIFLKMRIMPLKQLRWVQMERLLEEVNFATELYMKGFSEASDAEYEVLKQNVCTLISQSRVDFPGLPASERKYTEECYTSNTDNIDLSLFRRINCQQSHSSNDYTSLLSVKQLARHLETINHYKSLKGYVNGHNGHMNGVHDLNESEDTSSDTSQQSSRSSSVETMSSDSDDMLYITRGFTGIQSPRTAFGCEWPERHTRDSRQIQHSNLFRPAGNESAGSVILSPFNTSHFNDY